MKRTQAQLCRDAVKILRDRHAAGQHPGDVRILTRAGDTIFYCLNESRKRVVRYRKPGHFALGNHVDPCDLPMIVTDFPEGWPA